MKASLVPTNLLLCLTLLCLTAVGTLWLASGELSAQTVQLPSVRNFSYQGGALVPDRGAAGLGGNRSSAAGSSSRGVPLLPNLPHRSFGAHGSAGGVGVSTTIIDLDEMDRQILGYDPRDRTRRGSSSVVTKTRGEQIEEAKSLVRNARRAWHAGQTSTAKHAYELAINRLSEIASSEFHSDMANDTASESALDEDAADRVGQPTYLLAWARAEYARFFPLATSGEQP